ncbi:MAG: hypothetical protein ABIL78_07140 [candidate division WOR-3 bacterium]
MKKLLIFLTLLACNVKKPETGPSWDVYPRFPIGDSISSAYDIARKSAGKDSLKVVRIDDNWFYWIEEDKRYNDTISLPSDTVVSLFVIDFNKPKEIIRGYDKVYINDCKARIKLYFSNTLNDTIYGYLKITILFKESGNQDFFIIPNIVIPPGNYKTNPYIYEKDGFRIKAETTIVHMDFIANSSSNPNLTTTLDSAIGQFWVPPHFEAYDTVIAYKLQEFDQNQPISAETSGIKFKKVWVELYTRHSLPIKILSQVWIKDTVLNDSIFVTNEYFKSAPKDPNTGYSTGYVYDTIIVVLDTNQLNYYNQRRGKLKISLLGIAPIYTNYPERAYIRSKDSLEVWGDIKAIIGINQ